MAKGKRLRAQGIVPTAAQQTVSLDKVKHRHRRQPLRPRWIFLLAFSIPVLILALAYAVQGFHPVGDFMGRLLGNDWRSTTPLTIDLYHQYAPFLAELKGKLEAGESLFYSWNGGLGMNFWALIAYYAASPLNLILLVFPYDYLTEAITVMTLIKVGLTGLGMAALLRNGFSPNGVRQVADDEPGAVSYTSQTASDWAIILVSAAFALSGWMLAYSWDIMWLDAVALLPWIVLGLIRLVREGRFVLYTLALAAAIVVNYYIAVFICIFLVIYFFVYYFSFRDGLPEAQLNPAAHFLKRLLQFAFFSAIAGLISAFMSLPTWQSLQLTSAVGDTAPEQAALTFDVFEFMSRHLIDMEPAIRDGLPNIYVGLMVFILLPVFFFAKSISIGEKISHLVFLAVMYLSFNTNILNFLWHGGHYPNQLPYRYAFIYSFVVALMMYRAFSVLRDFTGRQLLVLAGAGAGYAVLAEHLLKDTVDHETALLSILLLLLYGLTLSLIGSGRQYSFRMVVLMLAVLMLGELTINTAVTITSINMNEHYTSREAFNGDFDVMRQTIADIEEQDPGFKRMEMIQQKTTNSPALYGYKGFTLFASTSPEETARLMRQLGYHGNNINSYKYMSSTALMNSVFGIEYLMNNEEPIRDPLLEPVVTSTSPEQAAEGEDTVWTYRNPYALPLGFMVDPSIVSWAEMQQASPFKVQDEFVALAANVGPIFNELDIQEGEMINYDAPVGTAGQGYSFRPQNTTNDATINFTVQTEGDEHVYFFINTSKKQQVHLEVRRPDGTGESTILYDDDRSINKPELFDAGYVKAGEEVSVKITSDAEDNVNFTVFAAALNEERYVETMERFAEQGLEITSYTSRQVQGTVEAETDGVLFLSIPYDPSWTATVDGQPVEVERVGGGLSGIRLPAGSHDIHLSFIPAGFWPGLLGTVAGLILLGAAALIRYALDRRERRRQDELAESEAARFVEQQARAQLRGTDVRVRETGEAGAPLLPYGVDEEADETGEAPDPDADWAWIDQVDDEVTEDSPWRLAIDEEPVQTEEAEEAETEASDPPPTED